MPERKSIQSIGTPPAVPGTILGLPWVPGAAHAGVFTGRSALHWACSGELADEIRMQIRRATERTVSMAILSPLGSITEHRIESESTEAGRNREGGHQHGKLQYLIRRVKRDKPVCFQRGREAIGRSSTFCTPLGRYESATNPLRVHGRSPVRGHPRAIGGHGGAEIAFAAQSGCCSERMWELFA